MLSEISKNRSGPGILIFDLQGLLLYSNREALNILAGFRPGDTGQESAPETIYGLCRLQEMAQDKSYAERGDNPGFPILVDGEGHCYALRPFLIGEPGNGDFGTHFLILIEKVVERRKVDIEKARREFQLTKREAEMVRLICGGFTNREIAEKKFISEYTVKVHIKSILKKMKAGSRSEVVALLK